MTRAQLLELLDSLPQDRRTGCVLWPFGKGGHAAKGDTAPYAYARVDGNVVRVARVALARKLGRDLLHWEKALHSCDNPPCVNEEHLRPGTTAENSADSVARGRSRGSRHTKLSPAEVVLILRRFRSGETSAALAGEFGVSCGLVRKISRGERWRDIGLALEREGHGNEAAEA